jgi:hypothetical protein
MLAKVVNDYSLPPISVTPWEYLNHNTYMVIILLKGVDIQIITLVGRTSRELLDGQ